jgi:geranylgeranyl pyrophosphate synthase
MLDVIGDAKSLGKAVGVDGNKNTFVHLYGLEKCEALVQHHTNTAIQALSAFNDHAYMESLAMQLVGRTV